ncbi:MAG: glycerol kinase GlpK [Elusimicrobia bacterium]|nr:glycerol kinase GlpK [Elusimicrobiota bacterium]MBU2615222.1 glycerol kinase GlpK [Elusimicrobiota bacterium]
MKYILAIDQGTTGTRAVVYNKRGAVVASSYEEFRQYFPSPGRVEHNPAEIWASVNNSIQKILDKIPKNSISAIGITNQRETTVIWDRISNKPVYNAIVWQCRRTAERCKSLARDKKNIQLIRKKTGLPIDAYFSATKIEWILKNVAGAAAKAKQGRLCFGTTDAWVLWNFTGGLSHSTDYTNASRTMLFNIEKKEWDNGLLKLFRIPKSILPEVKKSSGYFGKTVKIGKLPAGIPITGIAGDQQAALFGQACFEPGTIKNTYGTGSFVLMNTGKTRISSKFGLITTLGCGVNGEPVYVLEGAVFIAGAAVQWLRDGLGLIKSAKETEKMAVSLKDNAGVYFVPALAGLGAPYWNQYARGCISGITRGTTGAHLARAALEAMAYQTKDVLEAMKKDSRLKIKNLKVDGGATRNNFLCQFQADILRIPVIRAKTIESTSLGAAFLAGLAVGYWRSSADIAKYWQKDRVFMPKMNKKESDSLYEGWGTAVKRTIL